MPGRYEARGAVAIVFDGGHPQLAAVPWHVGVVPARPGQAPPAGLGARAPVKVAPTRQDRRDAGIDAGAPDGHHFVVHPAGVVALADGHNPITPRRARHGLRIAVTMALPRRRYDGEPPRP